MSRIAMTRRIRTILLIVALAAIILAALGPVLRGQFEPAPPPLPSEKVDPGQRR